MTTLLAAAAAGQTDPLRRSGEHFELVCHFDDEGAAGRALAIVEATWPIAAGLYGIGKAPLARKLEVHLYRDPADYVAAEAGLTHGRFRRNLAFAHWDTQTAHVAVQPELTDTVLARIGLTAQTLRLLAHEAAHLVRFHAFPNFRSHPDWFADGNASWIETEVLRQEGLLESVERDPGFATNICRVQSLLAHDRLPPVAAILHDEIDALAFYERYAVRWLLFRFLMGGERAAALRRVIAEMRRFGGGAGFAERSAAALRRELGDEQLAQLDGAFRRYVRELHPTWEQVARTLEPRRDGWLQAAFAATDAVAWRTEPVGENAYELRGRLALLSGAAQLGVLLGRGPDGSVSVDFAAGAVAVHRHGGAGPPTRLAAAAARIAIGRPFAFRVGVATGELVVEIDGERVLELDPERSLGGAWGLRAVAGSTGIWQNVVLETSR